MFKKVTSTRILLPDRFTAWIEKKFPRTIKYIGLSMSACIGEMLDEKMPKEKVAYFQSGTAIETLQELETVIATYKPIYWSKAPEIGAKWVREYWKQHRFVQPRFQGEDHNIADGIWKKVFWPFPWW